LRLASTSTALPPCGSTREHPGLRSPPPPWSCPGRPWGADRDHRGMGTEQDLAEPGKVGRREAVGATEPRARRASAGGCHPGPAHGGPPRPAFPGPRTGRLRKPCVGWSDPKPARAASGVTGDRDAFAPACFEPWSMVGDRSSGCRRCRFTTRLHIASAMGPLPGSTPRAHAGGAGTLPLRRCGEWLRWRMPRQTRGFE